MAGSSGKIHMADDASEEVHFADCAEFATEQIAICFGLRM